MDKEFYIIENGVKLGPFNLNEIKERKINGDDLVWKFGMTDWVKAIEIIELREWVNLIPPPLPINFQKRLKITVQIEFLTLIICSIIMLIEPATTLATSPIVGIISVVSLMFNKNKGIVLKAILFIPILIILVEIILYNYGGIRSDSDFYIINVPFILSSILLYILFVINSSFYKNYKGPGLFSYMNP